MDESGPSPDVTQQLEKKVDSGGMLTIREIRESLEKRELIIDPILEPELQFGIVTIDLRLDHFFC